MTSNREKIKTLKMLNLISLNIEIKKKMIKILKNTLMIKNIGKTFHQRSPKSQI